MEPAGARASFLSVLRLGRLIKFADNLRRKAQVAQVAQVAQGARPTWQQAQGELTHQHSATSERAQQPAGNRQCSSARAGANKNAAKKKPRRCVFTPLSARLAQIDSPNSGSSPLQYAKTQKAKARPCALQIYWMRLLAAALQPTVSTARFAFVSD
jgi:hypothetical protein